LDDARIGAGVADHFRDPAQGDVADDTLAQPDRVGFDLLRRIAERHNRLEGLAGRP